MIDRLKSSIDFRLNFQYFILQGLYWMIVCCTTGLASAYLSNRGYSAAAIGLLISLSSICAAVLQQIISVNTDSATNYSVMEVLLVLGCVVIVDMLFAIGTHDKSFATAFTFFIGVLFVTIIHPFLNALNFYIERHGIKMNYGVSRASGSLFFFVISLLAGNLMRVFSERVLPVCAFIFAIGFVVVLIWMRIELHSLKSEVKEYDPFSVAKSESITFEGAKEFIEANKMFFVILIGVMCFYFSHLVINNFIYQITVNVGGNESDTGGILALAAIVELPAMIFFNQLKERFSTKVLLGTSAVFFLIKIFVTAVTTSVAGLYISMLFQVLGFALYIPASVHFVDELMDKKDAVKGQAFLTIATTISGAIASLLGGALIALFGVRFSLWFSTFVTFVGVVIAIYGLFRIKLKK